MKSSFALFIGSLLMTEIALALPPGVKELPPADQLPAIKELPDPFLFNDGSRVKSKADWDKRRAELRALILYYEYGHIPPAPPSVTARELPAHVNDAINATEREFLLSMCDGKVQFHVYLTVPKGKGPFPAIIRGDGCWQRLGDAQVANVIKRGYVLADFDRTEIAADKNTRIDPIYQAYPDYDPSAVTCWAWGFHRVVDFLYTLDIVNKPHIAITGHSRGGKATLLAGTR